jgi:hypothetical protein
VVHGAHKSTAWATGIASAILAIGAVLSTTSTGASVSATMALALALLALALSLALLALILIVLRVSAKTAFTTPRLARALVLLRLVWSIIHSVIT